MRYTTAIAWFLGFFALASGSSTARPQSASPDEHSTIVLIFKDGHQEAFAAADVARVEIQPPEIIFKDGRQRSLNTSPLARIEFKDEGPAAALLGENHFLGRWKCGDGNGGTFFITLMRDGIARKSIGSTRGTWSVVGGEAHISWNDGWHDIIRKVGQTHEKVAFAPGRSLSEEPSNVADAQNVTNEPI